MPVATHYDTLKIARDAPPEVIRAVYKALAQKYHPDRNVGNAEAVQMMQMINDAYRVLADEKRKADHDAWIKQKDPPPPPPPLTPKEQELKKKSDACAAEAKKWSDYAAKMAAEAKAAREKAGKIAQQAKAAPADRRAAFESLYAREDAAAKTEEVKAQDAAKKAQEAADVAMKNAFSKDAKGGPATHYDTLKVVFDAPPEVIEAAARALSQKYHAENRAAGLAAVTNAVAILTDVRKKAEHDDWARKQMPKEQVRAQAERKPTGRELEAQARAEKAEAEAAALNALADRLMQEEKAAAEKAAQAAKDAQARAKDKDAAKWKAWAEKTAAEAAQEKTRSAKAAAKSAEASLKAQQARKEVEDAKAAADGEAALWSDKGK